MKSKLTITSVQVLGDEFVTIRDGHDKWSDSLLDSLRGGILGQAFAILAENIDADILDHPYIEHFGNRMGGDTNKIEKEVARLTEYMKTFSNGGYDERRGMLLTSGSAGDRDWLEGPPQLSISANGSFFGRTYYCSVDKIKKCYFPDGFHRMTAMAVLRKPFGVFISERHETWNQKRVDLYKIHDRKCLDEPIAHPDFDSWEVIGSDS